jgi:hypothetical protein
MNEKEIWERQVRVDFAKENPERMQARENGAHEAKVVKLNPNQEEEEELDMAA